MLSVVRGSSCPAILTWPWPPSSTTFDYCTYDLHTHLLPPFPTNYTTAGSSVEIIPNIAFDLSYEGALHYTLIPLTQTKIEGLDSRHRTSKMQGVPNLNGIAYFVQDSCLTTHGFAVATVKKPKKPATDQLKLVPGKYMIDGEGFGMWVIPRSSIPRLLDRPSPGEALSIQTSSGTR